MIDKNLLGKEQSVTLHASNGDFEKQAKAIGAAICDLASGDYGFRAGNIEVNGENAVFTFTVEKYKPLTEGQRRNYELLEKHGSVTYITQLQYVLVGEGSSERLDFVGSFKKADKPGFDRRALDNLVGVANVAMTKEVEHFGDFPFGAEVGCGFCIRETFRILE